MAIRGLWGRPYIDLAPYLDLSTLPEIHEEVCLALTRTPLGYTGGSHRSMGILPKNRPDDCLVDYVEVIRRMSDAEFETFRSMADDPSTIDPAARATATFGEEREHPLSRRQMQWLKIRFGVYFPWKGYVELIPNLRWDDKARADGKAFTGVARALFPKTLELVRRLPFTRIGRCNVMGLEAHDHGTVHRDGEPDEQTEPDHFITLCPNADKRLFLWDDDARLEVPVEGRAVWFNDHDYHGVSAAPFFRYSIRVDGVFEPEFLLRLIDQRP